MDGAGHPDCDCLEWLETLSGYLDGDVDDDLLHRIDAHIAECPRCAWAVTTLRETIEACRRAPRPSLEPSELRRVVERAREELHRQGVL